MVPLCPVPPDTQTYCLLVSPVTLAGKGSSPTEQSSILSLSLSVNCQIFSLSGISGDEKELLATSTDQRCQTCLIFKGRLTTRKQVSSIVSMQFSSEEDEDLKSQLLSELRRRIGDLEPGVGRVVLYSGDREVRVYIPNVLQRRGAREMTTLVKVVDRSSVGRTNAVYRASGPWRRLYLEVPGSIHGRYRTLRRDVQVLSPVCRLLASLVGTPHEVVHTYPY
uniref:Uncharacterized protein n=1 Tax=Timema monikensis TaxID=170555 RepID=A0A7R9DYZ5_9NEOP|nr:unnamed protein product [Timema monikensis]